MLRVEPEIKTNFVANGLVSLAFVHMLDHGNASHVAHRAAECAGVQSPLAFWQMHNLLFERQSQLWGGNIELLATWASELGLDAAAMSSCMNDPAMAAKVEAIDQGRRNQGIRRRPTFDLNGRLIEGALPYDGFVQRFAENGVTLSEN